MEYQSRIEDLQDETGTESVEAHREVISEENLSAVEMRNVRNTVSTWEALETERRLTKHALRFYDDVESLSGWQRRMITARVKARRHHFHHADAYRVS